jgi:glycosyltransferase involved in cell wall biosynthesis
MEYGYPDNDIVVISPGLEKFDLTFPEMDKIGEFVKNFEIDKEKFILLYFGSPLTIRGTDTIIQALASLKCTIPNIQLILLSRRKSENLVREEQYVEKLISDLQITDYVKIIPGFLSRVDIKNFIGISDVVVLPFKFVQADTPLSVIEAMALQKVVISTKMDGIPDLLSNRRGILIEPGNIDELVDAVQRIFENSELRKEIEMNARQYCMTLPDWDGVTQSYLNLINETRTI